MAKKGKTIVVISDEKFEYDIDELLAIHAENINREMDEVSALIGHLGVVLGAAKSEQKELDGEYRRWRAVTVREILDKEPKLAWDKVKSRVEETKKFLSFKKAAGQCDRNVEVMLWLVKGAMEKSANLRSRGAILRAEHGSQGMSTPERTRASVDDHKTGVRRATGRKKGKKSS